MTTYIAESIAAYELLTDYPHRPSTDEGYAASARIKVAAGDDETRVRHELAMHLIHSTAGMPGDRQKVYSAASEAIVGGVDAVQISGRVFRVLTLKEH